MPAVRAFVTAEPCAPPALSAFDNSLSAFDNSEAAAANRDSASAIVVERADGKRLSEIEADWRELVGRALEPNVFMHPAIAQITTRYFPRRRCTTLLAWRRDGNKPRLVGLLTFSVGTPPHSPLPLRVLNVPPLPHSYLATPVVDRDFADGAIDALLDFIAQESSLPKIVAFDPIRSDGPVVQALARVIGARNGALAFLRESARPMLASDLDGKQYLEQALSGSSRKKLRQCRRRLEQKGSLATKIWDTPETVTRAFDDFLALEMAGWKGRAGTALDCNAAEAAFAKDMIAALAGRGEASIHALTLQDKPVSMQIVLRSGPIAFTWKTAYDETLGDFSPGMLLLEDYTKALLADDGITAVDSCAYDDSGFMAAWRERQAIAQLWIDVRRGGSLSFPAMTRTHQTWLKLRTAAKHIYLARRRLWKRH